MDVLNDFHQSHVRAQTKFEDTKMNAKIHGYYDQREKNGRL